MSEPKSHQFEGPTAGSILYWRDCVEDKVINALFDVGYHGRQINKEQLLWSLESSLRAVPDCTHLSGGFLLYNLNASTTEFAIPLMQGTCERTKYFLSGQFQKLSDAKYDLDCIIFRTPAPNPGGGLWSKAA